MKLSTKGCFCKHILSDLIDEHRFHLLAIKNKRLAPGTHE